MKSSVQKKHEALSKLVKTIDECDSSDPLWWHNGAKGVKPLKDAKEALSIPLRNCDVGSAKEQEDRFDSFCDSHYNPKLVDECFDCPLHKDNTRCEFAWANLPYEGGDNDGK